MKKFMGNSSADLFSLPAVQVLGCAVPIKNLFLKATDEDCVVSKVKQFSLFPVHRLADAQIELEFAPVLHLFLKRSICKEPLLRAGKVQGLRHKPNQKDRSGD